MSAVMHADEINKAVSEELGKPVYHYHLHIVAIPTVRKEILWSKRCKDEVLRGTVKEVINQVSHSKKWKNTVPLLDENGQQVISKYGKPMFRKSYSVLQDKLFEHMTEAGFTGFERGVLGSTAENLSSLDYQIQKDKESIVGNCDEFLYLGGNEQSTHEYVSKLLGKETIDTNTYGRSRGRNGSYSTNYQLAGRELMTPDEVRMLDNRYALLFIRGERPIRDLKYDILHHPNVALTTDGSAPAYTHGEDTRSIASMAFSFDKKAVKNAEKMEAEKHEFLLYSEEELEELLDEKEKKDNEET